MEQQHPLFIEFRRDWLHKVTGYSKGYLSRVATGKTPLTRSFISQVCYRLNRRKEELFLPDGAEARLAPSQSHKS
ncbi:hypothetical protein ES703_90249 [subsurface metagenome]